MALPCVRLYCGRLCNFTSSINYDQTKLRSHLLACIEIGDLKPFPIRGGITGPYAGEGVRSLAKFTLGSDQYVTYLFNNLRTGLYHTKCARVAKVCIKQASVPCIITAMQQMLVITSTTCSAVVTTCK